MASKLDIFDETLGDFQPCLWTENWVFLMMRCLDISSCLWYKTQDIFDETWQLVQLCNSQQHWLFLTRRHDIFNRAYWWQNRIFLTAKDISSHICGYKMVASLTSPSQRPLFEMPCQHTVCKHATTCYFWQDLGHFSAAFEAMKPGR